jgi:DNA polymerase-3 subunit gamma/tau
LALTEVNKVSYQVLALKYRPQTFRDLVGQEHVSQTLQNAMQSGRVAHAFLFTGARGVGKTSAARILAKALTCEQQDGSLEPCNACPACREVTDGISTDVIEIDGASNTGVDDVRELRDNVRYLPSRLRYKIFIIDEVHMLSTSAFNALLKTLEEPPPHVKFIFATTEPHKVPVTVLSRCQRFDFRRIALHQVVARLREIVAREEVAISDAALAMVARKGDGSMRDSLSTLDQVLAFCGSSVADDDVVTLLGVVDRRLLIDASQAVFDRDCRAALDIVRRVDACGYSMRQFCQELVDHFRNLSLCRAIGDIEELTDLAEAEMADIRRQSAAVELADLQRHVAILLKAESEMAQSGFPRLVLEMALLKMATLAPALPVQELLARLDALRGHLAAGGVASAPPVWERPQAGRPRETSPAPALSANPPPPRSSQSAEAVKPPKQQPEAAVYSADWPGFVARVCSEKPMIASLLEDARPLAVGPGLLELGYAPNSFHFTALNTPSTLADLTALAKAHFGAETSIRLKSLVGGAQGGAPSIAEKKSRELAEQARQLEDAARSNPAVQAAIDIFGGELGKVESLRE